MYFPAKTLDDLQRVVLEKLLKRRKVVPTSRGDTTELTGVLLSLSNPRARLSRTEKKGTVFSCLGELMWYLAADDTAEFITYYLREYAKDAEVNGTLFGAYGPRLFNMRGQDQFMNVVALLKEKPSSRRAVIQLFNAEDIDGQAHKEVPCTCSLQFFNRDGYLDLLVHMRSNDAYFGLTHDVFCFTMLQEIMARTLGIELGAYKHLVGSLHLYRSKVEDVRAYLGEGWQSTVVGLMPAMPRGDPWPAIKTVLRVEASMRRGEVQDISALNLDPYWADLLRLLQILWHSRNDGAEAVKRLRKQMTSPIYDAYIARRKVLKTVVPIQAQLKLDYVKGDEAADSDIIE